jgi:Tol biopolymer transport system component
MALVGGSKFGPYEIVSVLGAGGMGEVYRARDSRLNREVALKVIPETFSSDADRMARFQREAQLLAALNHPRIAGLYGLEESGGRRALVMELVEGETLAERIARGPLAIEEAIIIAGQIAEALECAHERGIVHRDLKPANIKLLHDESVKILDFGLAKVLETSGPMASAMDSPTLTAAGTKMGVIVGTAAYMSPEQAKGKNVDRRSDIWSFGCVLYEMLTGKLAFPGETVTDMLAAVVRGEPDWNALPASTPAGLRQLLERCLRKDATRRLQSIGDARIALEEMQSGVAAAESTAAPVTLIRKKSRRRGAAPWAAAIAACAIGVAIGFAIHSKPRPLHFREVTNFSGVQAQPALSPDGRSLALVSNRDGHYNIYVGFLGGGRLVQVTNDANVKSTPRWSPDGTMLAYARLNDSGLWDIWQVAALGGTPRRLILNAKDPAWSPDGRWLAYEDAATRSIWMADSTGQNPRPITQKNVPWGLDCQPAFSPDGEEIAFVMRSGGPYGSLHVVEAASGRIHKLTEMNSFVSSPAWSADGKNIYYASGNAGTMNIWKISASGGTPEQITFGEGDDAQLDVYQGRIVFATFRENLDIEQLDLDKPAQPPRRLSDDPVRNQMAPQYSPDGRHLAYFSNLKGAEREGIWISNADGGEPVEVVRNGNINIYPRWSSDNDHLIYVTTTASRSASGADYRTVAISGGAPAVLGGDGFDHFFDVNREGRLLMFDAEGTVQSYDPASRTSQTIAHCMQGRQCWEAHWSPDERAIAYIVRPASENDPEAGIWVNDFRNPPRQIFRGWVLSYTRGPNHQLYILQGRGDLKGIVWRVGWEGQSLTRLASIQLPYSYWISIEHEPQAVFDVSPDGHHLAFTGQSVLQANIGMLER